MKTYTIKITGSGTAQEIETALLGIIDEIRISGDELDGAEWEDPILFTEIDETEK